MSNCVLQCNEQVATKMRAVSAHLHAGVDVNAAVNESLRWSGCSSSPIPAADAVPKDASMGVLLAVELASSCHGLPCLAT